MLNTTLTYIENDGAYLMLHRIKKKNDLNHDKWIGVGGKFEGGESPFDIETEIFTEWCNLLKDNIKPDLMICGHTHTLSVSIPGDELDARRQPCKVVVAAVPNIKENHFIGGGFVFDNNSCELIYSSDKEIKRKTVL